MGIPFWIEEFSEQDLDALLVYVESGQAAEDWDRLHAQTRSRLASWGQGEAPPADGGNG